MADLLAHAEVNSGSFYHFFESKEALLRAVLEMYLGALRPMVVDPAFARTDEPVARIFAILEGYRERILQTECQYGCPLGRLALEIDPENRPAHDLIAEIFEAGLARSANASTIQREASPGHRSGGSRHVCFGGDGRRSDAFQILRVGGTVRSHNRSIAGTFSAAARKNCGRYCRMACRVLSNCHRHN